jgi:hypothetical protein
MAAQVFGKSIFYWVVPDVLKGDPAALALALKDCRIERVVVKAAQEASPYKLSTIYYPGWGENVKPEWVAKLREETAKINWPIFIDGWGFCRGYNPKGEGQIAASQVKRLGLDGWEFDAEGAFDQQPSAADRARILATEYKAGCDKHAGWCSWPCFTSPYASNKGQVWHPVAVAKAALALLDFAAPMVYWPNQGAYWAVFWLNASFEQYRAITDKPYVPAGRLYTGDGGTCDVPGILAFSTRVKELGLIGQSNWHFNSGLKNQTWWTAWKTVDPWNIWYPPTPPEEPEQPPQPCSDNWKQEITNWARTMGYTGPDPC